MSIETLQRSLDDSVGILEDLPKTLQQMADRAVVGKRVVLP